MIEKWFSTSLKLEMFTQFSCTIKFSPLTVRLKRGEILLCIICHVMGFILNQHSTTLPWFKFHYIIYTCEDNKINSNSDRSSTIIHFSAPLCTNSFFYCLKSEIVMNERKSASVWKFHDDVDDCWCCKCASSELLWHLNRFMCFLLIKKKCI